jgi:hypothetical protein
MLLLQMMMMMPMTMRSAMCKAAAGHPQTAEKRAVN